MDWKKEAAKYCISNFRKEIKSDLFHFKECENRKENCFDYLPNLIQTLFIKSFDYNPLKCMPDMSLRNLFSLLFSRCCYFISGPHICHLNTIKQPSSWFLYNQFTQLQLPCHVAIPVITVEMQINHLLTSINIGWHPGHKE